jgi:pSer/pThr/pTyr-binding forkhead associated (FHA) protein
MEENLLPLAKIIWTDPQSGTTREFVLTEGATATIGRLDSNDICIKEQHVSRQHCVVNHRDGIFMITDLGSANGTFVNDRKLEEPWPLAAGDDIRLYVPQLVFAATVTADEGRTAKEQGTLIMAVTNTGKGRLIVTNGPQEGESIPLLLKKVTVGRAAPNAEWQISLQDQSVSRPHARLELNENNIWVIFDLGSANGTLVNGTPVGEKGRSLQDGDLVTMGATLALFRAG